MFQSGFAAMTRRKAVLPALAVLSVLSIASSVSAEAFSYYTTGVFQSSGTNSIQGVPPGSNLTFTGVGNPIGPVAVGPFLTDTSIHLGVFTLNDTNLGANNLDAYNLQNFTLNIFQVTPVPGGSPLGGTLAGQFNGVFTVTGSGSGSTVKLTLSGQVIAPGSVPGSTIVYQPFPNPETFTVASDGSQTSVEGFASAAPLPTSGLAGLALFGLVGAIKFRSRLFGMA